MQSIKRKKTRRKKKCERVEKKVEITSLSWIIVSINGPNMTNKRQGWWEWSLSVYRGTERVEVKRLKNAIWKKADEALLMSRNWYGVKTLLDIMTVSLPND